MHKTIFVDPIHIQSLSSLDNEFGKVDSRFSELSFSKGECRDELEEELCDDVVQAWRRCRRLRRTKLRTEPTTGAPMESELRRNSAVWETVTAISLYI